MGALPSSGGVLDQNWILMRQFVLLRKAQQEGQQFHEETRRQRELRSK